MGGYTRFLPAEDRYFWTKSQFEDMIAAALGGHVAEVLVFGEMSTGPQNDIERATNLARKMVCEYGMSERARPARPRPQGGAGLPGPGDRRAEELQREGRRGDRRGGAPADRAGLPARRGDPAGALQRCTALRRSSSRTRRWKARGWSECSRDLPPSPAARRAAGAPAPVPPAAQDAPRAAGAAAAVPPGAGHKRVASDWYFPRNSGFASGETMPGGGHRPAARRFLGTGGTRDGSARASAAAALARATSEGWVTTALYYSAAYLGHGVPSHPESPARVAAVWRGLQQHGVLAEAVLHEPARRRPADLERVHTPRSHPQRASRWRTAAAAGSTATPSSRRRVVRGRPARAAGAAVDAACAGSSAVGGECLCPRATARPPRAARSGDGLLPVQQRRGRRGLGVGRAGAPSACCGRFRRPPWQRDAGHLLRARRTSCFFSVHQFPLYPGTGLLRKRGAVPVRGPR